MIKKILIALAIFAVVFVVVVALQPADYHVVRTATVPAPPSVVFNVVNDLHRWEAWSPWAKIDPTMKQTYEGPPAGVGAAYSWSGNSKVGEGRMTITGSHPDDRVGLRLEFLKPFTSTADVEFTFQPQGSQTEVTWSMAGRKDILSKAVCLFVSMDKMVGGDFEKGLAQLKSLVEAAPKK